MMTRGQRIAFLLINFLATAWLRAEVSTTPPSAYRDSILPLLTPLETVVAAKDPHAGKDEPGTVRLAEQVTRVEEDGRYLRAVHYIVQPYSAKGADATANDRYRFYSRQETVHLALAHTVLPDGTRKPLGPNAAFLQKGNRGSASVYDDAQDLVIVFPDVKPGVLCEAIVVYERKEPPVQGGYSAVIDWSAGWPVGESRQVLDFPAAWKDRLQEHPVAVKDVRRAELTAPDGRLRREWKRGPITRPPYEPMPAPTAQTGPATWLGTFASWNEMAAWYQALLAGQDVLEDELKAKVDGWTAAAKTPREILDILFDRVANDIRYEGLEFGISGLQPYACGTVWKNQYGDCKDKANLLAAMLRHRGVPAKVVLVNTEHAGLVHRDIPDFRHFDHAIAVAELPAADGGIERVFCDATIRHGRPGLLGPSSAGREVLAIDRGKAEWLKTPDVDAGEDLYRFDLELDEEGRLAGWLTLTAKGYYAVRLAATFAGADRETARERLTGTVSEFIDGAEVVDLVLPAEQRVVDEVTVKAYFAGPPRQRDRAGRLSLPFPSAERLFNDYGENPQPRQTSYFQWRDRIRVEAAVRLPAGWRPESLPQPLKLDTPPYLAEAAWTNGDGKCTATLRLDCRESLIAAEDVGAPAQANRSLSAWLGVPLLLTESAEKDGGKPVPAGQVELPLMPTGQGQMNLVDRLFPIGSDPAKRRAALDKVVSFFPNDPATVFDARVQLAYLKYAADEHAAAVVEFAPLAARRPDGVDAESHALARYLHALALHASGDVEPALATMREIAADGSLSDFRRGWAAQFGGSWLAARAPAEALVLLQQAVALGGDPAEPALVALIPAMASAGEGEALAKMLAEGDELDEFEDGGTAVLKQVTDAATGRAGELLPWLARARDQARDADRKQRLATAAAALEGWQARGVAYAAVRTRVLEALELRGAQYFDGTKPGDSAAATEATLGELHGKDRKKWLALAAAYLRAFEPTPQFGRVVWQLLGQFDAADSPDEVALFDALAEITAALPKSDDHYWECRFTHAWRLRDTGKVPQAEAIHRAMTEDPALPADFAKSAWAGLGEAHELQGRWKEAAACYAKFPDDRHGFRVVAEGLLRAGLMLARAGEPEEALATWKLLADVPGTTYDDSTLSGEIADAIAISADPQAALEQWKRTDAWWKDAMLPLLESLGLDDTGDVRIFLSDQADDVDARCRKAVADKDAAAVARDLAGVALSFRWLPCQIGSLQAMLSTYVRPLRPQTVSRQSRVLEDAAATVTLASPTVAGVCLRLRAGLAIDRGEPALALKLLDGQWKEGAGDDEHRERSGYLFAMAAVRTGQRLDDARAIVAPVLEHGPDFVALGSWLGLEADLLVKAGKAPEAIAFLRAKAADPGIKAEPETLASVTDKLDSLTKQNGSHDALVKSVRSYLEARGPSWYPHVGPADLDDPRVGDVDKVLDGDLARFHPAERFRLRMLIALSDHASAETREKAYAEALHDAADRCRTWPESFEVWSHAIDDEALPLSLRLPLMWKASVRCAAAGQVDLVEEFSQKPVFASFTEAYAQRYFPIVRETARVRHDGPASARAGFERLAGKEIDALELQLSGMLYALVLAAGDLDAAAAARDAMKSWKLAPGASGSLLTTRLAWLRLENGAKPGIAFDRAMRGLFGPGLERLAKDAPEGWKQRVDLEHLDDLASDRTHAVRAALILSGFGHDATEGASWLRYPGFWMSPDGEKPDRAKLLEFFKLVLGLKDDFKVNLALISTLSELSPQADGSWSDIDALLDANLKAGERPAVAAMIAFWRAFRDYRPGDPVDVPQMIRHAKQMSMLSIGVYGSTMEALVINGDRTGLDSLLSQIDPDQFTDGIGLSTYVAGLKAAGRDEELELVLESVDDALRKDMMTAWHEGSASAARRALDLAAEFDRAELLPAAWREDMKELTADPVGRALIAARLARLDRNWPAMLAALATAKDQIEDDDAGWHHLNAVAHVEMGKPDLARPHLDKAIAAGILTGSSFLDAVLLRKSLETAGK